MLVRVDHLLLGFDVRDVREVLDETSLVDVPLTPPMVLGLINLRGEVVTVIDARGLFGASRRTASDRTTLVVVQYQRELLSLSVDEVLEVATVQPRQFFQRPDGMKDIVRRLASAVVQREHDLVVVVDVAGLFEHLAAHEDGPGEDSNCAPS